MGAILSHFMNVLSVMAKSSVGAGYEYDRVQRQAWEKAASLSMPGFSLTTEMTKWDGDVFRDVRDRVSSSSGASSRQNPVTNAPMTNNNIRGKRKRNDDSDREPSVPLVRRYKADNSLERISRDLPRRRSASPVRGKGDWLCVCGANNYPNRVTCFRCNRKPRHVSDRDEPRDAKPRSNRK